MYVTRLNQEKTVSEFLAVKNSCQLAHLLGCNDYQLAELIAKPAYRNFKIPKKKGGHREIQTPEPELKKIQWELNYYLQCVYNTFKPNSSHGFILSNEDNEPLNILTNAKMHVAKQYVINIDITDFFSSISNSQIRNLFKEAPFSFDENISTCLTLLTTFEKRLPMGAPTSPVLSNLICLALDVELNKMTELCGGIYSRYADDITFSFDSKNVSLQNLENAKIALKKLGFKINEKKTRIRSTNSKQEVTGITVNKKPNVGRRYIRNIRAILHDSKLNGLQYARSRYKGFKQKYYPNPDTAFISSLKGKIEFVGFVRGKEDGIYLKMKEQFGEIITHP